ncbi:MAG: choice-of-anchor D domain-containing protein [Eubacteriales bacterium]|nr:choice-of-anchor D domain-containing protein [Eubacteriales bacterium]
MKPRKVLSIIMAMLMALTMLPSLVFAAEVPAGELGGRLKLKGTAAVGCELSADYEKVTPAGVTDDYVTFQWSRKTGEGAGETLTEVGTEKTYTVAPEDLGCKIALKVTGLEEMGITGSLTANTVAIAATAEEAPAETTEKTAEEKAAEGIVEDVDQIVEEQPQDLPDGEEIWGEETPMDEVIPPAEDLVLGQEEVPAQDGLEDQAAASEDPAEIPETAPMDTTEDPGQAQEPAGGDLGIQTDDSAFQIGTAETLNIPETGEEAPGQEQSVSYDAQVNMEEGETLLDFGTVEAGFEEAPERKNVTITNTGTGTLHFDGISPEHFMVADVQEPLEAGQSVTVWIQPRAGVGEGVYQDTISYTTEEGITVSFDAMVTVETPAAQGVQASEDTQGEGENLQTPDAQNGETTDPAAPGTETLTGETTDPAAPETETPSEGTTDPAAPEAETPSEGTTGPVTPGEGTSQEVPVTVTPAEPRVTAAESIGFGSVIQGYGAIAAQTLELTNGDAVNPVRVLVTVENGDGFAVTAPEGIDLKNAEIPAGGKLALQICPKEGLGAGEYEAAIKAAPVSEPTKTLCTTSVTFAVAAATRNVSAAPAALDFGTVETGYAVPAPKDIVLTNTGNSDAKVTIQPNGYFDVYNEAMAAASEVTVPANNGTAVLKVQPKAGLGAAAYTDKPIVLSAEGAAQPISVAAVFHVKAPDTFGIVLSLSAKDFGTAEAGYAKAPAAETVTVTNTGSTAVTLTQPTAKSFEIGALSAATLAPNASAVFTVRPKLGLTQSVYEEDILVASEKSQASLKAIFTVTKAAVKLTGIDKPSGIAGLANGTKKTADALGLPGTVVIKTTNGKMKAKVKWDVKGCSYEAGSTEEQTFSVKGTVTLPDGVTNPDKISRITSVKVTVNGRTALTADPNNNTIGGIRSDEAYTTETKITITANGAGMDNTAPGKGDTRYVPVNWKVLETRVWETAPYTATFRMGKGGSYTLSVAFNQQKYDGSTWVNTGAQDVRQVSFTVAEVTGQSLTPSADRTDAATRTAVLTGDSTPILTFVIILIVAVVCIVGILVYRKKRK